MLKSILRILVAWLYRVDLHIAPESGEHPQARPDGTARTLIVANHESLLDGVLLWLYLPHDATFVVHTEVARHWLYRHLLKRVPHLAISPANPMAIKQVVKLVEQGRPVVIFPEGRLTTTGALMKIYDGSAFVAARTGARVIPVRIEGSGLTPLSRLGGLYPRKLFPRISISVQAPRTIPAREHGKASERRRAAGDAMSRLMQESALQARPRETLFQAFLRARRVFGGGHPLVEDVRRLEDPSVPVDTYDSILKTALAVGRLVAPLTEPGERVGVLMPNVSSTVGLVLGVSAAGRVPAMLNYTAGRDGLAAACRAARIGQILTSRAFLQKAGLADVVEGLEGVRVHHAEDLRQRLRIGDRLWLLQALLRPAQAFPQGPSGSAAVVLFTSGSEGKPKGVVHSHDSILANVAQVRAMGDFRPLDKFMVCLPLFHSFGFTAGTILPLVSGYRVFLYPSPLHYRAIPEVVYDRGCTVLFGTSTFLAHYARMAHPYDFSNLRYVIAGAEKLAESVRATWFEKFGIRILEGYGVTECAPVVAVNTRMAYRTGSVGRLTPGLEHRLEPMPGIERGGQLLVRGPQVMAGYLRYENPGVLEPTAHEGQAGWYATGDICELDDDGFLFIKGRVKRFCKIAGEMVSLEVVERLAQQAAPAAAHAAVSVPSEGRGEALVLFTTDPGLTARALSARARELGIPELAVPRRIVHLERIPVLGTGKTDYVRLKDEALRAPSEVRATEEAPQA